MIIALSPVRSDASLTLHRAGDVLTINGTAYDLAPLPEGAILPQAAVDCPWLASDITRQDGRLRLTLLLPHGAIPWPAPPEAAAVTDPMPLDLTDDGPVAVPLWQPALHPDEETGA